MHPPYRAQQYVPLPTQADQLPHTIMPTRRTTQEVMGLSLSWLVEVEHCER